MRPHLCSTRTAAALWLLSCWLLLPNVYAYFVIDTPTSASKWKVGEANPVRWTKGLADGIDIMDVEIARLGNDGLTFVARNVPTKNPNSLNILLQDFPVGDDYFLILINSTHGVMYATSQRFSIVASSTTDTSGHEQPDTAAPTVTISGAPNPTRPFATTMAPANGAVSLASLGILRGWSIGSLTALFGMGMGGYYVFAC